MAYHPFVTENDDPSAIAGTGPEYWEYRGYFAAEVCSDVRIRICMLFRTNMSVSVDAS